MKILLIGDYSMVHRNLKDGLEQLGHTVVLTADGDYWKELPGSDFPLMPCPDMNHCCKAVRAAYNRLLAPFHIMWFYHKLCLKYRFDVIHVMSADLFPFRYRKRIYRFLNRLSQNRLSVSIPGDDIYIYEAWKKGLFRYSSFDDNPEKIRRFDGTNEQSGIENAAYRYTAEHARALIPLNPYETEMPFAGLPNLRKVIPLPINLRSVKYEENAVKDRIVLYHGISHDGNKGTGYILEALDLIKKKYGNRVEVITTCRIPYNEFLKTLRRCNVYIDQCKSYSYGMAAVIAMAMGKAVLSGREPEIIPSLDGYDCPVINIIPETRQIAEELEKLINEKEKLMDIGLAGRKFTEEYHDCCKVAGRYLKVWTR